MLYEEVKREQFKKQKSGPLVTSVTLSYLLSDNSSDHSYYRPWLPAPAIYHHLHFGFSSPLRPANSIQDSIKIMQKPSSKRLLRIWTLSHQQIAIAFVWKSSR